MGKNYSESLKEKIQHYLADQEWHFWFNEETGAFEFILNLQGIIRDVKYFIDVWENDFIVYAICPFGVDSDDHKQMENMSLFLSMANYGLRNGNFELDVRDGEIRYKSFMECKNMELSFEAIDICVSVPAMMFERYVRGIMSIILNNASAVDAISLCEDSYSSMKDREEEEATEEDPDPDDDPDIPVQ